MEGTSYFHNGAYKGFSGVRASTSEFDLGRSGVLGDGPRVYISIGDEKVFIPRVHESEFFESLKALGDYFGY